MSPSIRCTVFACVAIACGKPSHTPPDGSAGDGNPGTDDGTDSALDAGTDAPIGPLTPDPADPASSACAGLLGFPGPGAIPADATEMLAGDIDGDGIIDLVYSEPNAFRIARGNGNGTFAASTTFSVPLNARPARLGHIDQDGKLDLVFAVPSSAPFATEIRAALNNANGGFGASQSLYTFSNFGGPSQLEIVDVNADGKNDLIALSMSSLRVAVLISNGTGFAAPQLYTVADLQYAHQMALGDITGDGRPDIVVTESAGAVNVLVNNGNGTFGNRVRYPSVSSPWAVVLADANEDGMLDVLVGTAQPNMGSVSVLLNQGAGTFGSAASYSVAVQGIGSDAPRSLAVADVNGDGHVDVGAAYTLDSSATILRGDGTGQFGSPLRYAYDAQSIWFADLQGDTRPDMLLLGIHTVTAYANNGTQAPFEARTQYEFGASPLFVDGARTADLDGDGRLDLIGITSSGSFSASTVMTKLGSGNQSFDPPASYPTPIRAQRSALSDLNNDGRMDLVLLGQGSSPSAQILLDNADGSLTTPASVALPPNWTVWTLADVDQDGRRDLVIGDVGPYPTYASTVRYYRGTGTGAFGSATAVWTGTALRGVTALDLNGDAKRDLVISSVGTSYQVEVLLATTNGSFAPPTIATATAGPGSYLFARDFNADGNVDVVGIESQGVVVMLSDGAGALGPPLRTAVQGRPYDAAFADFDGDGHLDVVVTGVESVGVLLGRGDGTFRTPRYYESTGGFEVSAGDMDGDGRIDILVPGGANHASVLYGRCL